MPVRKKPKKKAAAKKVAKKKAAKKYVHRTSPDVTEAYLTAELSEELLEAWQKLRRYGDSMGPQRIYASHRCIMFSRKVCYFFVRPKKTFLEVCIFLPREVQSPLIKRSMSSSKTKFAHIVQLKHADQVEEPLTDWIHESYQATPDG